MKGIKKTSSLSKALAEKRELASICGEAIEKELARGRLKRPGSMRNLRRWLMRKVVKSEGPLRTAGHKRLMKAAAIILLMSGLLLSGGPAGVSAAQAATFTEKTGAGNPFDGFHPGNGSRPALVDIDSDGDMDAFVGEYEGLIFYYENTGTAENPAFTERTGDLNPLSGASVYLNSDPTFVDMDSDGDFDAFVADGFYGTMHYYENIGNSVSPDFEERTGDANPLKDFITNDYYASAVFVDIDSDGDMDVFAGYEEGYIRYYKNTGSAESPTLTVQMGNLNPLNLFDVVTYATPGFVDMDFDGDLDVVVGGSDGAFRYYENTGSAQTPAFTLRTGALNPFDTFDVGFYSAPAFKDMDADGDMDAIVGAGNTLIYYFENNSVQLDRGFTEKIGAANPLDGIDAGYYSTPVLEDIDSDGDLDVFVGEIGVVKYYENTGSAENPAFIERIGALNPLDLVNLSQDIAPAFADIDGDGDLDAFVGEHGGAINYYENTGSAQNPAFTEHTGALNPLNGADIWYYATPTFADIDSDGDLDFFQGGYYGNIAFFENTGNAESPVFVWRKNADNPLDSVQVGDYSTIAFADLDGDGDLDAFVGEYDGTVHLFENTGSAKTPVFTERIGALNPLDIVQVGPESTPTFADLDADGDLDAFVGEYDGTIHFYENSTVHPDLNFTEKTGGLNPLDGFDVGTLAIPTFADIDGDGDLDAFVGEYYDGINFYENIGNSVSPDFIERTGALNPLGGFSEEATAPVLVDIDGDGDLDAFSGEYYGTIKYYENIGNSVSPDFTERTGVLNPFNGVSMAGYSSIVFVDMDSDGDYDAFGCNKYYENIGNSVTPDFIERTGALNPLNGVGGASEPNFVDLDSDGDLDAFVGAVDGTVNYYENIGNSVSPNFIERTGALNPINGFDVGDIAVPAFADIDADGDPDVFVGASDGTVFFFEANTAPRFTGTPAISGIENAGETLSLAGTETFDSDGDTVTLSYQWKVYGVDIINATSATYILTADELNKSVSCAITADDGEGGIALVKTPTADADDDGITDSLDQFPFTPIIMGDLNNDGVCDLKDVMLGLKVLTNQPTTPDSVFKQADVNGDGKIGNEELSFILQKVSGRRP